jgi:hypothetical protein
MAIAILFNSDKGKDGTIRFLSAEDLIQEKKQVNWNRYFFLLNNAQVQGQCAEENGSMIKAIGIRVVPTLITLTPTERDPSPAEKIVLALVAIKSVDVNKDPDDEFAEEEDILALDCGSFDEPDLILKLKILK